MNETTTENCGSWHDVYQINNTEVCAVCSVCEEVQVFPLHDIAMCCSKCGSKMGVQDAYS